MIAKHKIIGVAIIENEKSEVLIDRRLPSGSFGGYWEFPGGKLEPHETVECCIRREIREELGLEIEVGQHLVTVEHIYNDFQVTLIAHLCRYLGGEPQLLQCQEIRWSKIEHLIHFTFPQVNHKIIEALYHKRSYL
jgi:mutator protein MutT